MCNRQRAGRGLCGVYLAAAGSLMGAAAARANPFFMGSDISLLTFMQQQGVVFKDNGVAQQADQILYDNGDNLFRLRLFVNPQTTYTNANSGAIQTTAYDIALAQQIKANDPSAKFELDLHYSDTWADPGHQTIPAAWTGQSLPQLQTSVYNYTLSTLDSFNSAGVMPDMVEIGNETNNGMLWPTGELNFNGTMAQQQASWAAFGSLVNSGISAVRAAQGAGPKIQVSLTIGNGDSSGEPAYFYGNLTNPTWGNVPASSFDVMGVDYYPSTNDLSTLSSNLTTLANTFNKKIMVMETDAPWETNSVAHDPAYAETQAGQAAYLGALASTVQNLPNGDGMGLMYWYPEAVQLQNFRIYNGGATALFDGSGNALQAVNDFNITQNVWNTSASGSWNASGNWSQSVPNGSDVEADFLGAISANQTVSTSTALTLGTIRFESPYTYTLGGTGSISLQATVGWGYIVVQQGAQQISVPTTVASSSIFSVSTGCSLTFTSPVTVAAGQILKPSGAGTINYLSTVAVGNAASMTIANSTHSTGLTVGAGATVSITGTGTVLEVDSLSNSGTIDIQGNSLIINYGSNPDPIASIASYILSGFTSGEANGPGIISSLVPANPAYGVGYADAADPGNPAGLPSGEIEVKYTLLGDANLDGKVNGIDFAILAANFNQAANGWDMGDFNHDGKANGIDFTLLAANFNQGSDASEATALDSFAAANGLSLNVPEPVAGAAIIVPAIVGLFGRRRRWDASVP